MPRFVDRVSTRARLPRAIAGMFGAAALLSPLAASAFFQETAVEGTVGADLGGVWLSVQQIVPEFRVSFPKPATGRAVPFTVQPVPADLEPVMGKPARGVSIAQCSVPAACLDQGLLEGDIVVAVNSKEVASVADFEAAVAAIPQTVLLNIRRPALKMTMARLVKMHYEAKAEESQGASTLGEEKVELKILDVQLPFGPRLEATRESHTFFQPGEDDVKALTEHWFEYPPSQPVNVVNAHHRIVAAPNYDEALAGDKNLRDTKLAIVMDMDGNPMSGGGKVIDIYGVQSIAPKTIEGTYVTATIASAPFPINVEFKGRFHMTRLADWSDADEKYRIAHPVNAKPKEDLNKFKLAPEVPAPVDKKKTK